MESNNRIVAAGMRSAGRAEGVSAALLKRLLSSTALASMLLLQPSTSSAQTMVTVTSGKTVTIPSDDHNPEEVSRVVVQSGGTLITNHADIKGSVSGSGEGVIKVEGTAELSGGSISNTTDGWGNALYAAGAGANVIAEDLALERQALRHHPVALAQARMPVEEPKFI